MFNFEDAVRVMGLEPCVDCAARSGDVHRRKHTDSQARCSSCWASLEEHARRHVPEAFEDLTVYQEEHRADH